jgi:hypothetical protein
MMNHQYNLASQSIQNSVRRCAVYDKCARGEDQNVASSLKPDVVLRFSSIKTHAGMFALRVTVSHINLVIAFDSARIVEWGPLALLFKLLPFTELPTYCLSRNPLL